MLFYSYFKTLVGKEVGRRRLEPTDSHLSSTRLHREGLPWPVELQAAGAAGGQESPAA